VLLCVLYREMDVVLSVWIGTLNIVFFSPSNGKHTLLKSMFYVSLRELVQMKINTGREEIHSPG